MSVLCRILPGLTLVLGLPAGEVFEHQPLRVELPVVNQHDRAVRVEQIERTCACSDPVLGSHFLLPHERTTMSVEFDNRDRSGPQSTRFMLMLTDPDLEFLEVTAAWTVIPDIAVDLLPVEGPFDQRPTDLRLRDRNSPLVWVKPDEGSTLRRDFRLWSPPESRPGVSALEITRIDYAGTIWSFQTRKQSDQAWLVLARARDPQAVLTEGRFEETVTVHTNHPHKPKVLLYFKTAVDSQAGKQGAPDPWGKYR